MFVLSIVTNKPYFSTRLILPVITSPMVRLSKAFTLEFGGSLSALDVLKVTSILFDNGSRDNTLRQVF